MSSLPDFLDPQYWLVHVFSGKTIQTGGMVRRHIWNVERTLGQKLFRQEFRRTGFRSTKGSGHFVTFCNHEPLYPSESRNPER